MALDLSDVETRLDDLNEILGIMVEGCRLQSSALENHTKILVHQTGLLNEIKAIMTAEPEEESPLIATLKHLAEVVDHQATILVRIEKAIAAMGSK